MGPFGVNGGDSRRDTHGLPATDHGKDIEAIKRKNIGDDGGRNHTRGSGNPVGEYLHIVKEGNCGAVGDATSLI